MPPKRKPTGVAKRVGKGRAQPCRKAGDVENKQAKKKRKQSKPANLISARDDSPLRCVVKGILSKLVDHDSNLYEQLLRNLKLVGHKIDVVTACSGSEIHEVAGREVMDVLGTGTRYTTSLASESDARKIKWIQALQEHFSDGQRTCCLNDDIAKLSQNSFDCKTHEKVCTCRSSSSDSFMSVIGWSCIDLSTYKSSKKEGLAREQILKESTGSSATTLQAALSFLDTHVNQKVHIGENVEEIAKPASANRQFLLEAFAARGWAVLVETLRAEKYGSATARCRAWIVAVHPERSGMSHAEAEETCRNIFLLVRQLEIESLADGLFMLDKNDAYVARELQRQKAATLAQPSRNHDGDKWPAQFSVMLSQADMSWSDLKPPTDAIGLSEWYSLLPKREKMLLLFAVTQDPSMRYLDISQTIGRHRSSDDEDTLFTITPASKIMLMKCSPIRPLTGYECMLYHGWPRDILDAMLDDHENIFPDTLLKDLAGNSFVAFVYCALLISVLVYLPAGVAKKTVPASSSAKELVESIDDLLNF